MPWNRLNDSPGTKERVICALCYLTGGIAGIIYIIISRSSYQSSFFRFHFLQSIVLTIIAFLSSYAMQCFSFVIVPLLSLLADLVTKTLGGDMAGNVFHGFGLLIAAVSTAYGLLFPYGAIWSLLGKVAEIPFLSNVVRHQMR